MIVMKFGGSSVGTAAAIGQVAGLVEANRGRGPVIVVSALQGVTDRLLALSNAALAGDLEAVDAGIVELRTRHRETAVGAAGDDVLACLGRIDALIGELGHALRGVAALKELSPRSLDLIVSFGERLSAPIVAAALVAHGVPAEAVDARELIVTDDRFTSAAVLFPETNAKIAAAIPPLVEAGRVPVVTGFIGATADGITTTLGRGGSDYSVAIVAGAVAAEEIWIWKEVDGVMTADPRTVPDAALLCAISYDEAAEMSYFGAKVLHPKTMIPAVEKGIPIRMRNTFRPEAPGTVIGRRSVASPLGVKVVTAIKDLAMVTVEGKGMMGIAGFAAQVLGVAGRHGINVVMFSQSSSEQNICLVTGAKDGHRFKAELEREFREQLSLRLVDRITVEDGVAAVAIVGEGMKGAPGVAARLFGAVAEAGVNVLAIAQGSSERNVSFIVRGADADAVVRGVHAAFALHKMKEAVCA
ncbi:MAG TPA: aspartate kinase [Candidatus Eisenbacteria bacterium]|jgi:aspartate kinase|nr:aspartate kinase [Candidatus Eisenbacteria bacterium]